MAYSPACHLSDCLGRLKNHFIISVIPGRHGRLDRVWHRAARTPEASRRRAVSSKASTKKASAKCWAAQVHVRLSRGGRSLVGWPGACVLERACALVRPEPHGWSGECCSIFGHMSSRRTYVRKMRDRRRGRRGCVRFLPAGSGPWGFPAKSGTPRRGRGAALCGAGPWRRVQSTGRKAARRWFGPARDVSAIGSRSNSRKQNALSDQFYGAS